MHTDGHCNSMTDSAQWADSVKIWRRRLSKTQIKDKGTKVTNLVIVVHFFKCCSYCTIMSVFNDAKEQLYALRKKVV